MAVFEAYYDELSNTIGNVGDNSFASFAGKLFAKKVIDMQEKRSATRQGLVPGAQELLNGVMRYVKGVKREEKDRTKKVLEIMDTVEWLKDLVKKMRGENSIAFQ